MKNHKDVYLYIVVWYSVCPEPGRFWVLSLAMYKHPNKPTQDCQSGTNFLPAWHSVFRVAHSLFHPQLIPESSTGAANRSLRILAKCEANFKTSLFSFFKIIIQDYIYVCACVCVNYRFNKWLFLYSKKRRMYSLNNTLLAMSKPFVFDLCCLILELQKRSFQPWSHFSWSKRN